MSCSETLSVYEEDGKDSLMYDFNDSMAGDFMIVDLTGVRDRQSLHDRIQEALPMPEYYGRNLDAFYDVINEYGGSWKILFRGCEEVRETMPAYLSALERLCMDAEAENAGLSIIFED